MEAAVGAEAEEGEVEETSAPKREREMDVEPSDPKRVRTDPLAAADEAAAHGGEEEGREEPLDKPVGDPGEVKVDEGARPHAVVHPRGARPPPSNFTATIR